MPSTAPTAGDYRRDFGPLETTWLDCAHQGPLPRVAAEAVGEALGWKRTPSRLDDGSFETVPRELKATLARLIGASPDQIVLGNSASYGLHVLAASIPWREGDEVLVVAGDFPATILPWTTLADRGVTVRFLEPGGATPTGEELAAAAGSRTRVVAVTWVSSFTGQVADLRGLGEVCEARGIWLVVNASQGLGALPLDVSRLPVAAVSSCGWKWLCGPYATGFAWIRDDLLGLLRPRQRYWLAWQRGASLDRMRRTRFDEPEGLGARALDLFGTANFLNFVPWRAALEYLHRVGTGAVAGHDRALWGRFRARLDPSLYRWAGADPAAGWTPLWVISHRSPGRNPQIAAALAEQGIRVALREGNLRVSPHLHNVLEEIDSAVDALHRAG